MKRNCQRRGGRGNSIENKHKIYTKLKLRKNVIRNLR